MSFETLPKQNQSYDATTPATKDTISDGQQSLSGSKVSKIAKALIAFLLFALIAVGVFLCVFFVAGSGKTEPKMGARLSPLPIKHGLDVIRSPLSRRNIDPFVIDAFVGGHEESATNQQHVRLLLDTGSYDLWVPAKTAISKAGLVDEKFSYDKTQSESFQDKSFFLPNTTFRYLQGKVKGSGASELFQIESFQWRNDFVIVEDVSALRDYEDFIFDGIMGLGPNLTFSSVLGEWALRHPVFSFYFDKKGDGEFVAGKIEATEKCQPGSDLEYVNVMSPPSAAKNPLWVLPLRSVYAGYNTDVQTNVLASNTFSSSSHKVLVDTGANFVFMPADAFIKLELHFLNLIPETELRLDPHDEETSTIAVPCHYLQDPKFEEEASITLEFDSNSRITLKPSQMLEFNKQSSFPAPGEMCTLPFRPSNDGNSQQYGWTIGNKFLVHFYTVFNFQENQIGFCPANVGSNNSLAPRLSALPRTGVLRKPILY